VFVEGRLIPDVARKLGIGTEIPQGGRRKDGILTTSCVIELRLAEPVRGRATALPVSVRMRI
jgi:hypothetical protein